MPSTADARAGRAAFTHPGFVLFQIARFLIVAAVEMQAVAVGWQVYEITKRPLDLGYVGLAQFLPGILLFPISGHVSDRYERSKVLTSCYAGYAVCFALFLILTRSSSPSITAIYVVLILVGIVRSFNSTASRSILPQLVPLEHFPNAVAWNATIFQAATILGPSFGGLIYAGFEHAFATSRLNVGAAAVYGIATVTAIGATISSIRIKPEVKARPREPMSLKTVFAGLDYIWNKKLILGAISLDLFRRASWRSGGFASGVCKRDSAHWTVGPRTIAHRPGSWRGGDGCFAGPPSAARAIGTYAVMGSCMVWNLHDRFRPLAQPDALPCSFVPFRRERHDQRHHSRNSHSTRDSG